MLREFKVLSNNGTEIRAQRVFVRSYSVKIDIDRWGVPRRTPTAHRSGWPLPSTSTEAACETARAGRGWSDSCKKQDVIVHVSLAYRGTLTRHPSFQFRSRRADTCTDATPRRCRVRTLDVMSRVSRTARCYSRWRQRRRSSLTHQHLSRTKAFASGAADSRTSVAARSEQRQGQVKVCSRPQLASTKALMTSLLVRGWSLCEKGRWWLGL